MEPYADTDNRRGQVKGMPRRFIRNHHMRKSMSHRWNGGVSLHDGFVRVPGNGHPRQDEGGYVLEHLLVVERAMGKPLPQTAIIHHVNTNQKDNRPSNLVVCEDQAYHMLLHQRLRAFYACGHASWIKCKFCKLYDDPSRMFMRRAKNGKLQTYHRTCRNEYERKRRAPCQPAKAAVKRSFG